MDFPSQTGSSPATCLVKDGFVKCFGPTQQGRCGLKHATEFIGDQEGEMGPNLLHVDLSNRVINMASSNEFSCAILSDNNIQCWGNSTLGRLGPNGYQTIRGLTDAGLGNPFSVSGNIRDVICGRWHACIIIDDGFVKCWGDNRFGQLGIGQSTSTSTPTNVDLGIGRTAMALTCGEAHVCAMLDNHDIVCWGFNEHGELGAGDTITRGNSSSQMGSNLQKVDFGENRKARKIAAGMHHTCAILDNDQVKCWGYNQKGQLGIGDTSNRGDNPGEMGESLPALLFGSGIGDIPIKLSLGRSHSCALFANRRIKCWGDGHDAQLGVGNNWQYIANTCCEMDDNLRSVDFGATRSAIDVRAFERHTCAILDDSNRSVVCWGKNDEGNCGLANNVEVGDTVDELGDSLVGVDWGFVPTITTTTTTTTTPSTTTTSTSTSTTSTTNTSISTSKFILVDFSSILLVYSFTNS